MTPRERLLLSASSVGWCVSAAILVLDYTVAATGCLVVGVVCGIVFVRGEWRSR